MRGKMIGMEIVVNFQKPNNSDIALQLQTNKKKIKFEFLLRELDVTNKKKFFVI